MRWTLCPFKREFLYSPTECEVFGILSLEQYYKQRVEESGGPLEGTNIKERERPLYYPKIVERG